MEEKDSLMGLSTNIEAKLTPDLCVHVSLWMADSSNVSTVVKLIMVGASI